MICPQCQTPNPDFAALCLECSHSFSGDPPTMATPHAAALTSAPTKASPSSLKEWAAQQPTPNAPSDVLPPGLEIGRRYRVKSLLGMGGMGAVYLVHDEELDRDVAMKLIRPDFVAEPGALERFKREIQLSSRITHTNVLRVFDLGEADGIRFLTMQFVEGRDLATVLKSPGRLPPDRVLRLFRQICEGLKAAHEQGVVHRDLKPQNAMVDAQDHLYVTDFGLAKSLTQSGMTQTGAIVGTPFYMAPEQVRGQQVGPQADIFALGVILYQMLAGTVPFTGESPFEVMMARLLQTPRPLKESNPETPPYLQKIVERCLAVDTAARYQTVEEILRDLDASGFRTTMRFEVSKRPWLRPALAVVVAALIVAGAAIAFRARRAARPAPPAGCRREPAGLARDPAVPQCLGRLLPRLAGTQPGRDAADRRRPIGIAADRSLGSPPSDPSGSADLRRLELRSGHAAEAREVQQRGHRHLGAVPQVRQRDPDRRHDRRRQAAAVHSAEGAGSQPEWSSGRHRSARPVDPRRPRAFLRRPRRAQGHGVQAVHEIARGAARLQRRAAADAPGQELRGAEEVPGVDPGRSGVRPRVREARTNLRQPGVRHGGRAELAPRRRAFRTASGAGEVSGQRQPRPDRQRHRQGDRRLRDPRQGVAGRLRGQLRAGRPLRGLGRLRPGARPLQEGPRARSEVRRRPSRIGPGRDQGREPAGIARLPEPGPEPRDPARAGRREGRRAPRHRGGLPGTGEAGRRPAVLPGIARDQAPHRPETRNRRDPRADRPGPGTTGQFRCRTRELQGSAADPARDRRQEEEPA